MPPGDKPLLVFDGECGFCRYWVDRWRWRVGDRAAYVAWQDLQTAYPDLVLPNAPKAVHFVDTDGTVYAGAEGVYRLLALGSRRGWLLALHQRVPGFRWLAERSYRMIAANRDAAAWVNRILWGLRFRPPTYRGAAWLFQRNLGLIFFVAFLSFYVQAHGLIGSNGILPIEDTLEIVASRYGAEGYWQFPTLAWIAASDTALSILCFSGMTVALLLAIGFATPLTTLAAYALYLSIVIAGRDFMSFQWDTLLLETALVAAFLTPIQLWSRPARAFEPVRVARWLLWWLLFRLMFSSGMVKLADPTWTNFDALGYHYETQPLPTAIGWYVHQMPDWFHSLSTALSLVIESGVPFLIAFPRRVRHTGGLILMALLIFIFLTGNYGFFNWLALALCILLFDDQALTTLVPRSLRRSLPELPAPSAPTQRKVFTVAGSVFAVFVVAISLPYAVRLVFEDVPIPESIRTSRQNLQQFFIVNNYGLFAHMTTTRPEIVIEGSMDGAEWKPYAFRWKPGDLKEQPRWVAPHMPRLDWQMWFAALSTANRTPWFGHFALRLFEGSPDVLALLEHNPFPDRPPRYIRATLYRYEFTTLETKSAQGTWWRREPLRRYFGPYMRSDARPAR